MGSPMADRGLRAFGGLTREFLTCDAIPSPAFVVNEVALRRNLSVLRGVMDRSGCRIIQALKGFSMWSTFPIARQYLVGAAASSLNEAKLAAEFGGEVHTYAPAYLEHEFDEICALSHHVVFNSVGEFKRFADRAVGKTQLGLRVNPQHSEGHTALYDPCSPGSRLGAIEAHVRPAWDAGELAGMTGLHMHTLCEQNSDALERTVVALRTRFGDILREMDWINLGGGHHITREDYDEARLERVIKGLQDDYGLVVYLEPGEAVALNTGVLVSTVLDVIEGEPDIAMLDTSATAHMPDVLEMPYRPQLLDAGEPGEKTFTYKLGGLTCLAGDFVGSWSFDTPLKRGDRLIFGDMAHYTMVKTSTFNGVNLPSIVLANSDTGDIRVVRTFGYDDFKNRLS